MKNNQWGYNLNRSDIWQCDWFDTKEEAIQAADHEHKELDMESLTCHIGQIELYIPSVDLDTLMEHTSVDAYDECGEISESWLNTKYIDKGIIAKYNEKLNQLFDDFLVEANEVVSFGRIVNVESIIVLREED
jgi:hypothetical protein